MALLDDVSLKLLFIAENAAQDVLDGLLLSLKDLLAVLKDLQDADPFMTLQDGADALTESVSTLNDEAESLAENFKGLGQGAPELQTVQEAAITLAETLRGPVQEAFTSAGNTAQESALRMATSMQETAVQTTAAQQTATAREIEATQLMADRVEQYWQQIEEEAIVSLDSITAQADTVANMVADSFGGMSDDIRTQMQEAATEIMQISLEAGDSMETALESAAAAAKDVAAQLDLVPASFEDMTSQVEQLNAALAETMDEAKAVAESTATLGSESAVGGTTGTTGGIFSHGGLGSTMLMGGMNAMMGYYGMQMLGNAGMQWSQVEQMQRLNNQTPQEAAQAMAMMGIAGMTGSSGVSFLSGLAGQLRQTFTPQVGTGMLSQQAILLESLGINQQDIAQSPWMLMQTIAGRYNTLQHSGQGASASELLSLTGTSQLASLFQNWQTAQKQTTGMLPGMTTQQVDAAAKQGVSMEASMQKLAFAFDQLALTLIPIVQPLIKAFTNLVTFFTSGGNEVKRVVGLIAGVAATIAGIDLAKSLLRTVSLMRVMAGVVNVMGGAGGGTTTAAETATSAETATVDSSVAAGEGAVVAEGGLLAGTLALVKGAFASLGALLAPIVELVGSALAGAWAALSAVVMPLVEIIGGALLAAVQAVGLPIEALIAGILAVGVGIYELITHWRQVTGWLGRMGADFGRWVSSTIGDFTRWVGATTQHFGQWAAQTTHSFLQWAQHTNASYQQWIATTQNIIGQWTAHTTQNFATWGLQTLANFMGWNKASKAQMVQWAANSMTALLQWSQHFEKWVGGLWKDVTAPLNDFKQSLENFFSSLWNGILTMIPGWLRNLIGIGGGGGGGGGGGSPTASPTHTPGDVTNWIQQAMKDAGVSGGQWSSILSQLVMTESGGNPNAVSATGVNYGNGHGVEHAAGLAQMMPSTFAEYMQAGMTNILSPIDNLVASINYIMANFGNPGNMAQQTGLGTSRYIGYATGGIIQEPIVGQGMDTGQHYLFGEAGPEYVVPFGAPPSLRRGMGGGAGHQFNITVAVNAMSSDPRLLAQQVADQLVQNLKRRANLAWSP